MRRIGSTKGGHRARESAGSGIVAILAVVVISLGTLLTAQFVAPAWTRQVATTPETAKGEILGIDRQAATVILRPVLVPYLNTAELHRTFPVRDRAVLDKFKVGDTVQFVVWDIRGEPTVTRIRPTR